MKDRIELENNRNENNLNYIYLFKDNDKSPWYKAYNFSAYLLEFYNKELSNENRLKPTHKKFKSINESVIYVGLQFTSFNKYIPNITVSVIDSDKIIKIPINLQNYDKNININNYLDILSEWKNQIQIKDNEINKKENKQTNIFSNPVSFTSIIKKIIIFNTTNKSENELLDFIYSLKTDCANLI